MDQDSLKLLDSLVESSALRKLGSLKKYAVLANDILGSLLDIDAWKNSQLLLIAFMWYEYIVYNFQLYMIPLSLLCYVLFRLISVEAADEFNQHIALTDSPISVSQIPINVLSPPAPTIPNGQTQTTIHPLHKLQTLVELVKVIQAILPIFKSVHAHLSRLAELMDFELISWAGFKVLLAVTLWVYFIGLRYLLMIAGFVGFVKIHPASDKLKSTALHVVIKRMIISQNLVGYLPDGRIQAAIKSAVDVMSASQQHALESHSLLSDALITGMGGCFTMLDEGNDNSDVFNDDVVSTPTIYLDPIELRASASLDPENEPAIPSVTRHIPIVIPEKLPLLRHRNPALHDISGSFK